MADIRGSIRNLQLRKAYHTIINCYQESGAPNPKSGFFPVGRKDDLIGALKDVSRVFKGVGADEDVPALFYLLYMHAQITGERYRDETWRANHAPDAVAFDEYLKLLLFYSAGDKDPATSVPDRADYKLRADSKTFMAAQLYLARLLTEPFTRAETGFSPPFDWILKDLLPPALKGSEDFYQAQCAGQLTAIINHMQKGSTYYRGVLSPIALGANLFPDYLVLPIAAELGADNLVKDLPDGTHGLWMAGLPACPPEDRTCTGSIADGGFSTAAQFWLHEMFHLSVFMQGTHRLDVCGVVDFHSVMTFYANQKAWLETRMKHLETKKEAHYEVVRNARKWYMEKGITEDEKAARLFVAFFALHETRTPLNIVSILQRDTLAQIKSGGEDLNIVNLRNELYYRGLLSDDVKEALGKDIKSPMTAPEAKAIDKIKAKYGELCTYLAAQCSFNVGSDFEFVGPLLPDYVYGEDVRVLPAVKIGGVDCTILRESASGYMANAFLRSDNTIAHWVGVNKEGTDPEESWIMVDKPKRPPLARLLRRTVWNGWYYGKKVTDTLGLSDSSTIVAAPSKYDPANDGYATAARIGARVLGAMINRLI